MAPLIQVVFLIDVNYFIQWNSSSKDNFEHWRSKLYLSCLRLLTEFGAQTDKENIRWAFKFYNSKKFKPDISHKDFNDFTISSLKKFEQEIHSTAEKTQIENRTRARSKVIPNGRNELTLGKSPNNKTNKYSVEKSSNEITDGSQCHSHSYILNKSLQEILLDYNWDRPDISSPVKCLKKTIDTDRSLRCKKHKQSKVELPLNEDLNFVIVFTNIPKNDEECSLFIGKETRVCSSDIFKSLFDQATLHGFKVEKKLRFHLINISKERIDTALKTCLQTDLNKLQGGIHEIDNLVRYKEEKEVELFDKKKRQNVFLDPLCNKDKNNQGQFIKGTELSLSSHQWWSKKKISSRSRVPQPGPLLIWEDIDGVSFLKIPLELLSIQGSSTRQWEDMHVKGIIRGNAMNLLGIGLPSSLLYVCHAPDTIFPVLLSTLSEQNLFMILQLNSGNLVGLAPWVGGVGCLVLFSSTQLTSPLAKSKSTSENVDGIIEKGLMIFIISAIKKVLKNAPEMSAATFRNSCFKRFQPQMIKTWYPACEASSEKLQAKHQKRSITEQSMLERLQKKYRPQMPRPLSGSHLPPQALVDVTQPAAAAAVPDVPSTISVLSNLRSSKLNVSRAQKLVKNSKLVTAQMKVKEQQAEEQEQQAACERKTIEAQNRAKKSIAIVAKTMKHINNPQDKDELAQALIRLRDNIDSVTDYDNGQSAEDLYSTAQSVVNLALMHIKTNSGPKSVEGELRNVLSRKVLLSAKQVSEKCGEKYQLRQYKIQSLLLLEVLWVLGYSRPNSTTPNKRKSPRKKKDIGEEYIEEILKLLRIMSLKYDPASVGEFLRQIIVPSYQESLGEILVEIFEELNLPLPSSLAAYANEDDLISPVKPLSVKSFASSMSNGPNSCDVFGMNCAKEGGGVKPSTRPLLKREPSNRQIVVPHVRRNLHRINTTKEESKPKTKGSSSKRELKSVCRNLFDKRDKLKRSHTVAGTMSNIERTPGKGQRKRKFEEIKSPLNTPSRNCKKDKNMATPTSKRAKILVPETPVHAIKTTVFTKQRVLKSTGSTLITESPDIKGNLKSSNVSRRSSLSLTRRTSFYSGGLSRNFERGKHQLRVSHIKGQIERRNSSSNVSDGDASFIFSEIIQNNSKMELRSQGSEKTKSTKENDSFFREGKPLKFGLDKDDDVEPHRPSFSGRRVGTPRKKLTLDSPLKKVRRSLSLLTPIKSSKGILNSSRSNITPVKIIQCNQLFNNNSSSISTSSSTLNKFPKSITPNKSPKSTFDLLSRSVTPNKSPRCTSSVLSRSIASNESPRSTNVLFRNMTPNKSLRSTPTLSRSITPTKSRNNTSDWLSRSITPNKSSRCTKFLNRSITPNKSPRSSTNLSSKNMRCTASKLPEITPESSGTLIQFKIPENISPRKSPRIKSPDKATETSTPKKSPRIENLRDSFGCLNPRKSPKFGSPNKTSENMTPRKSLRIEKVKSVDNLSPRKSSSPFKSRKSSSPVKSTILTPRKSFGDYVLSSSLSTPKKMMSLKLCNENAKKCSPKITSPRSMVNRSHVILSNSLIESSCKVSKVSDCENSPCGSAVVEKLIESNYDNAQLNFDSDDSDSSNNFVGFNNEDEQHRLSSRTMAQVLNNSITDCVTPSKRVQFNLDSTPTKSNTISISKMSLTPKSILKTPHKSPNKTPIKLRSSDEKSDRSFIKGVLENTPTKSNMELLKLDYFRKPSPFVFSPKSAFDSFTPPVQKENKMPSTIVNEIFKNSTPTHFAALLHSPITSVEREKNSTDKFSLGKKTTNSHMKSHRRLQLTILSPSKLKSPEKCDLNWEFKEILNSPKKFLLDSCTEFEMVSPVKNILGVKTDLVFHDKQDEKTISKVVEMSFQKGEKVIQELPADQIDLTLDENKIDEKTFVSIIHEEHQEKLEKFEHNCINDNDTLKKNQIDQMEYKFNSTDTEVTNKNNEDVRVDMNQDDLDFVASLLRELNNGTHQKISENAFGDGYISRKISHQDSDSGISVSNHLESMEIIENELSHINSSDIIDNEADNLEVNENEADHINEIEGHANDSEINENEANRTNDSDVCLKQDINNLICLLASPFKAPSKVAEVCEQDIGCFVANSDYDAFLGSSNQSSYYSELIEKSVMKEIDVGNRIECIENDCGIDDEKVITEIKEIQDQATISPRASVCKTFNDSSNEMKTQVAEEMEFEIIESHLGNLENENTDIGVLNDDNYRTSDIQDSLVVHSSDNEDGEIKEFPNIELSDFSCTHLADISLNDVVIETTSENHLEETDIRETLMEIKTYQMEVTNYYELSPEIPLGLNTSHFKKHQDKIALSSTKRKLVFLSGDTEVDVENSSKERKLSIADNSYDESKSFVLEMRSEQPISFTASSNEEPGIINHEIFVPEDIINQQDPKEKMDMEVYCTDQSSVTTEEFKLKQSLISCSSIPVLVSGIEDHGELEKEALELKLSDNQDTVIDNEVQDTIDSVQVNKTIMTMLSEKDDNVDNLISVEAEKKSTSESCSNATQCFLNIPNSDNVVSQTITTVLSERVNNFDNFISAEEDKKFSSESFSNVTQCFLTIPENDSVCVANIIFDDIKESDSSFIDVETHSDNDDKTYVADQNISCNSLLKRTNLLVMNNLSTNQHVNSPILMDSPSTSQLHSLSPNKLVNSLLTNRSSTSKPVSNLSTNQLVSNQILMDSPSTSEHINSPIMMNSPSTGNMQVYSPIQMYSPSTNRHVKSPIQMDSLYTNQHANSSIMNSPSTGNLQINSPIQMNIISTNQHVNSSLMMNSPSTGNLQVNTPIQMYSPSTNRHVNSSIQMYSPSTNRHVNSPILMDSPSTNQHVNSPIQMYSPSIGTMQVNSPIQMYSPSTNRHIKSPILMDSPSTNQPVLSPIYPSTSKHINSPIQMYSPSTNRHIKSPLLIDSPSTNQPVLSPIYPSTSKHINSPIIMDSPSTSHCVKKNDNVTPRRSNRKSRQTSFFESPICLDENNYALISPVFSSKKKAKLKRTSRKLYSNLSEHFDNCEVDGIKERNVLPQIPEENLSFIEGIDPLSPVKGRLSDSFEVVSPMKNIKTFAEESGVPEEQKTPIVIKIRRKKKTPNCSPRRPVRASKLKALKNIEQDIEKDNWDEFDFVEN